MTPCADGHGGLQLRMQALWIGSHQKPPPLQRGLVNQRRVVGRAGQAEHLVQGAKPHLAIISRAIA
jgi:hypothetical protein